MTPTQSLLLTLASHITVATIAFLLTFLHFYRRLSDLTRDNHILRNENRTLNLHAQRLLGRITKQTRPPEQNQ